MKNKNDLDFPFYLDYFTRFSQNIFSFHIHIFLKNFYVMKFYEASSIENKFIQFKLSHNVQRFSSSFFELVSIMNRKWKSKIFMIICMHIQSNKSKIFKYLVGNSFTFNLCKSNVKKIFFAVMCGVFIIACWDKKIKNF